MVWIVQSAILAVALLAVMSVLGLLLATTAVRVWLNERWLRASKLEHELSRLDPTGRPYPPSARGLCSRCNCVLPDVHYLPNGTGLCRSCYDRQVVQQASTPQPLKTGPSRGSPSGLTGSQPTAAPPAPPAHLPAK